MNGDGFSAGNDVLRMRWKIDGETIDGPGFQPTSLYTARWLRMRVPFTLLLGDGSVLSASALKLAGPPLLVDLPAEPAPRRYRSRSR